MNIIPFKTHISAQSGSVSCEAIEADNPRAILVLAHGAGAGMHHQFMTALAKELATFQISSVRFQFPYMEKGKKRPDTAIIAQETIHEVILETQKRYPSLPMFAGGKSFGGRMTSLLFATKPITGVQGLIFFGFPLHQPGKPSIKRAGHLEGINIPMLFLQGTRDKLATIELIKEVTTPLTKASLNVLEGADHSFHVLKSSGLTDNDILSSLASTAAGWMVQVEMG